MSGGGTAIAVDAVGGDHAPDAVVEGAITALSRDPSLAVLLVGPEHVVADAAKGVERLSPVVATEVIEMEESPTQAVRTKRDSSIAVGCRRVKEGKAAGFFSAGNTGAVLAAGTLAIGRIPGVSRPAIGAVFSSSSRRDFLRATAMAPAAITPVATEVGTSRNPSGTCMRTA